MATFLLLYRPGPAWVDGKPVVEQPSPEHGRYLLRLYARGQLRWAGPLTDDTGAAVVVDVDTLDAAHALAQGDPAIRDEVFVYECHPWQLIPWEDYLKPDTTDSHQPS